jgi:hypothetical protein
LEAVGEDVEGVLEFVEVGEGLLFGTWLGGHLGILGKG